MANLLSDILNASGISQPGNTGYAGSQYSDQVYGKPTTYSFTDVTATIILPFNVPGSVRSPSISLPGLTLVSMSEHRDVYPVVGLGRRGIKGFTTGHKTIAGTLGFNIFGETPFADALKAYAAWRGRPQETYFSGPDELPPIDLSLLFETPAGDSANIMIRSLKILDYSRNISVRDIQLTEVCSFMAANVSHLINATSLKTTPLIKTATIPASSIWLASKPAPVPVPPST